jgi:hypothetical protein
MKMKFTNYRKKMRPRKPKLNKNRENPRRRNKLSWRSYAANMRRSLMR